MILSRKSLRFAKAGIDSEPCLLCQCRGLNTSPRRLDAKSGQKSKIPTRKSPSTKDAKDAPATPAPPPSPLADAPRSYGRAHETFTPKPLPRPIGLPNRPRAGDNTGIDPRSLKQRRDDFVDYDKHLARRKELTHKVSSPYFREWDNMRFSKGKTFIAPSKIFKAEFSLYFPNLRGQTLLKDKTAKDTTPVLEDKISIVSMFNTTWAENQTNTFVSEQANPELSELVKGSQGIAQMVKINHEDNWLKALLVKLFMGNLRKRLGESMWARYFLIRKGFKQELKEGIGMLNSKVGYTYVLDTHCRIRWAGSGNAQDEEKEGLVRAVSRLIEDQKARKAQATTLPLPQAVLNSTSTIKPAVFAA